jgi:hypothetical protein
MHIIFDKPYKEPSKMSPIIKKIGSLLLWPLDDYFCCYIFLNKKFSVHVFMLVLNILPRHISWASFMIRNKIKQGLEGFLKWSYDFP